MTLLRTAESDLSKATTPDKRREEQSQSKKGGGRKPARKKKTRGMRKLHDWRWGGLKTLKKNGPAWLPTSAAQDGEIEHKTAATSNAS